MVGSHKTGSVNGKRGSERRWFTGLSLLCHDRVTWWSAFGGGACPAEDSLPVLEVAVDSGSWP
jgi:hypothetical protein